jgi:hypothetical protein
MLYFARSTTYYSTVVASRTSHLRLLVYRCQKLNRSLYSIHKVKGIGVLIQSLWFQVLESTFMQQVLDSKCFFWLFLCTTSRVGTSAPGTRTHAESTGNTISSVRSFGGTRHSGWSLALRRRYCSALELKTNPRASHRLAAPLLIYYPGTL